jgi:hypothetical protein
MRFVGFLGIGLALALVSTSTLAFQEQGGGAPAVTTPAPNAAPEAQGKAPGVQGGDMNFSSASKAEGQSAGTEVRIPGLGKLGVLPKMDFGLELLYGANEGAKQPDPVEPPSSDDLTIRGTMKHNF